MTAALDVVALPLEEALSRLRAAGIQVELEKTYPAKPFPGNGKWRVVRQTTKEGKVLVVAAEECEGISP